MDPKPKKAVAPKNPNETPQQKLTSIANARVTKAVKSITSVGGLTIYKPSASQTEELVWYSPKL